MPYPHAQYLTAHEKELEGVLGRRVKKYADFGPFYTQLYRCGQGRGQVQSWVRVSQGLEIGVSRRDGV